MILKLLIQYGLAALVGAAGGYVALDGGSKVATAARDTAITGAVVGIAFLIARKKGIV